ncbi:MAG TPA: autotransporter-associated beta strand repeat-containing protein, partial [Candidatus Aquilonibacter sp.]|nr:autotransporter-associated beta strand repeat-containing protein [Candidatus Aquilonibacter sp.]
MMLAALSFGLSLAPNPARAASATWLPNPTDNQWFSTNLLETNWSTGPGTYPGANGTSSADIGTFNTNSSITNILIAEPSSWTETAIGGILFDSANCASYTFDVTAGELRLNTGGYIAMDGTVTNSQAFTGTSFLRIHPTTGFYLTNNSPNVNATLSFAQGFQGNNTADPVDPLNLCGSNTGSNVVGGVIEDYNNPNTYAPAAVNKLGPGTWYLTGVSTYTGPTTVTGGLLVLAGPGSINRSTNVVVNGSGAILSITTNIMNLTDTNNFMFVTNSGTLQITNTAFRTPVTVSNLVVNNATLQLGVNAATPFTNIVVKLSLTAGPNIALNVAQVANLSTTTTFDLISYVGTDPVASDFTANAPLGYSAGPVTVDTVHKLVTVAISTAVVTPPKADVWNGQTNGVDDGDWDTTTTNWISTNALLAYVPTNYTAYDTVTFDDTLSGTANVNLTTALTPTSITLNNNNTNYVFSGIGNIIGTASLLKQGSGTLTIDNSGVNSYTGGNLISAGVVQVGNNDANGNLSGLVTNNATLIFDRSDNALVRSNVISGTGSLM